MTDDAPARKRWRPAEIALFVVIGAVVVLGFVMGSGSALKSLVGKPAPDFKLATRSGANVGPADHRGKFVLIDFWAAWCAPCFRQMPKLAEARDIVGPDELVILSVNLDEPTADRAEKVDRFIGSARVDFDTLLDNGSAKQLYGVTTLPSLVLVDRVGVVRWAGSGVHDSAAIVEQIEDLRSNEGEAQ